ncbi:unnamed protein product [Spirodela intermedia]|uniref:Protein kinase domain-containing protein n=1 Tax=Spirodela intermedia TaxID=51605 RepID=A0A7I8J1K9_SPIIN|nr:unnamed protein product [Spirodela intermedia]CAA6663852.1 unnamed protein product [Spirodela intermedia]
MRITAAQAEKTKDEPRGEEQAGYGGGGDDGSGREEKGKTVVVGVRMDAQSRELLTWALVKVAEPGDLVVAVHDLADCSSLISIIRSFDSVLAAYEGFCNLKQIDLKLKICRGSPLRKILVREVHNFAATRLVLGAAKNDRVIGSLTSVARHCAKRVHRECSVLAVKNGKILFRREAPPSTGDNSPATGTPRACRMIQTSPTVGMAAGRHLHHQNPSARLRNPWPRPLLPGASASPSQGSSTRGSAGSEDSKASVAPEAIQVPARFPALAAARRRRKPSKRPASGGEISCVNNAGGAALVPEGDGKNNREKLESFPRELQSLLLRCSSTCRLFSYQELVDITSNFSLVRNLIGKGGGSRVYRGFLPDGGELAVKLLQRSEHVLKDFVSEVEILTALHHRSVIALLGFCFEDENYALVYDYLPRGSLEENIHGAKSSLRWIERYDVAVGVAEALDYLHGASRSSEPVIHGDVKSSNILLSDDLEPRLSDFGLARWRSSTSSHLSCSDIAGTFGYLAPEYLICGKVNEEVDVYAFGVVLLELLTGRKPIDTENPGGHESLVLWAKPILQRGKVTQMLDPRLGDEYNVDQVERMALAAALCIKRAPDRGRGWTSTLQIDATEELAGLDEDDEVADPAANIQSYLSLALLDVEDDTFSVTSSEHTSDFIMSHSSLEEYLRGRWSLHSSFG